jgi:hypothetical protein
VVPSLKTLEAIQNGVLDVKPGITSNNSQALSHLSLAAAAVLTATCSTNADTVVGAVSGFDPSSGPDPPLARPSVLPSTSTSMRVADPVTAPTTNASSGTAAVAALPATTARTPPPLSSSANGDASSAAGPRGSGGSEKPMSSGPTSAGGAMPENTVESLRRSSSREKKPSLHLLEAFQNGIDEGTSPKRVKLA